MKMKYVLLTYLLISSSAFAQFNYANDKGNSALDNQNAIDTAKMTVDIISGQILPPEKPATQKASNSADMATDSNKLSTHIVIPSPKPQLPDKSLPYAEQKVNGKKLFDIFTEAGVPAPALKRLFDFLDMNASKTVSVKAKLRDQKAEALTPIDVNIKEDYAAIIDYSLPSTEPRFYLLNLTYGTVSKYLTAHGKNTGALMATSFSNKDESKKSSLGIFLVGPEYYGKHGKSIELLGLEASNNNAAQRDIVIHSASYVSPKYVSRVGLLGRSWGCPAVEAKTMETLLQVFKQGTVVYAFHKDLMKNTLDTPELQEVPGPQDTNVDLPGEEGN